MTWTCALVATDLSLESARAADACLDLPGHPRLLLVHVGEPTATLEAEAGRLRGRGAEVEVRVTARGGRTVSRTLLETAAETGADLIAVGTRGRGRAVDRLLGSVSEGVIRGAQIDALLVREWSEGPLLARPLIPIDLSSTSLEAAERLEDAEGSDTGVLVHVGSVAPAELAPLAERLGLEWQVRPGAVVPAIVEAAIDVRATVIALTRVGAADAVEGVPLGPVAEGVAFAAPCPVLLLFPRKVPAAVVRELIATEFSRANDLWLDYHETRGDPAIDRVFGLFVDDVLASLARCRRHPDGYEVDAVFTPVPLRGRGYAGRVMGGLVEACHNEDLYMYAVAGLEPFYGRFGFVPIPEARLPRSVHTRYDWAMGDMEAAEVTPMLRPAGWFVRDG